MTITVKARLRRDGAVYIAGETIVCDIYFANTGDSTATIQWCSAQLHCQQILNTQKIRPQPIGSQERKDNAVTTASTSFHPTKGESGATMFSSKPQVLFCELVLNSNEEKHFEYSEGLPDDITTPSHKGYYVKYFYKVTIGVQVETQPVKLLRCPFRLITAPIGGDLNRLIHEQKQSILTPANPFLDDAEDANSFDDPHKHSAIQAIDYIVENLTATRQKHSYNITWSGWRVCALTIYKTAFKLGEQIRIDFDFCDSNLPCVQVMAQLQSVEVIQDEYKVKPTQCDQATTYVYAHAYTLYHRNDTLLLDIPLDVTPSFITEMLNHKWRLLFEFVLVSGGPEAAVQRQLRWPINDDGDDNDVMGKEWQAPQDLSIETMQWELPVKIFSSNPYNIALTSTYATQPFQELQL